MADLPTLKKNYYLFHATDVPNSQRVKYTLEHVKNAEPLIKNGTIVAAGGLLPTGVNSSDVGALDKAQGSVVIVQANSEEHAWELLKKDIFYASGEVWDHSKATLTPFFAAVPQVE